MNEKQIRKTLHYIIKNEPNSIKAFVAKEALQRNSLKVFFQSVKKRGCISGIISTLNYYPQTHDFFETYYDEIEKLRILFEQQNKIPIQLKYDLKTSLSWFAFEQTAHQMASDLKIFDGGFQYD